MHATKHGGVGVGGGGPMGVRGERRNPLVKQLVLENDRPAKISHLNFGLLSEIEMMRLSEMRIHSKCVWRDAYGLAVEGKADWLWCFLIGTSSRCRHGIRRSTACSTSAWASPTRRIPAR
jgi:hypothetical protein